MFEPLTVRISMQFSEVLDAMHEHREEATSFQSLVEGRSLCRPREARTAHPFPRDVRPKRGRPDRSVARRAMCV